MDGVQRNLLWERLIVKIISVNLRLRKWYKVWKRLSEVSTIATWSHVDVRSKLILIHSRETKDFHKKVQNMYRWVLEVEYNIWRLLTQLICYCTRNLSFICTVFFWGIRCVCRHETFMWGLHNYVPFFSLPILTSPLKAPEFSAEMLCINYSDTSSAVRRYENLFMPRQVSAQNKHCKLF